MEKMEQCVMTVVMGECRAEIGVRGVTVVSVMMIRSIRGIKNDLKTK